MAHIIPTIGPAIASPEILLSLHNLGVRILRFNFTHFSPATATPIVDMIHQLNTTLSDPFQMMMDIEGPSMRIGDLKTPQSYTKGQLFRLVADPAVAEGSDIHCDYPQIVQDVNVGSIVRIESGLFDTIVREKYPDYIILEAQNDFILTSKRHINLPNVHVNQPTITDHDIQNMQFAVQAGFSYISISFCRTAEDIRQARTILQQQSKNQIKLIAKIENQEGIDNLDEIVDASDIVMVARGDLGTEVPIETIPEIQMHIVKTCKLKNTPVIVATQMLSSMVDHPAPTRAEVSDIFLAVREGADYLMLSEETTVGKYPLQAVDLMKKTIEEAQEFDK